METFEAAYLKRYREGDLEKRCAEARRKLKDCDLCGNRCHINRLRHPDRARCRTGGQAIVGSIAPHHGEERPISGFRGSGTIFFGRCNLACVFCQNGSLSHGSEGETVDNQTLARQMLGLQAAGCHNINFVSPSHVIPQILAALLIAASQGLRLPLVYNSGGYDSPEGLALLDGIIDIYMPDMKFADSLLARRYTGVEHYAETNRAAVKTMHQQVGDLVLSERRIARRGLLVRHLVLPDDLAGSETTLRFLAEEISRQTYLNVMDQYRPCFRAGENAGLDRRPNGREIQAVRTRAQQLGLSRLA